MPRLLPLLFFIAMILIVQAALPQTAATTGCEQIVVCPGAFPTDLTKTTDCSYTATQRTLDFVSGSVTDQTVLGAVVFGLGAQVIKSPPEWKRTWEGYGYRVGSRYTQALGKGSAPHLV